MVGQGQSGQATKLPAFERTLI